MSNERQPCQLSSLEALPAELLQQIFFYAFEVNMPRASPHLANVLSNSSIYSALVLFAYFEDDKHSPVEKHLFKPAWYRNISVDNQRRLQEGILSCRWCTLEFLKSCMPDLSRLQMVQAWHREYAMESEFCLSTNPLQFKYCDNKSMYIDFDIEQREPELPHSISNEEALERHFFAKQKPPTEGNPSSMGISSLLKSQALQQRKSTVGPTGAQHFLPRIVEWNIFEYPVGVIHKSELRVVSILATRVLPDHILKGHPVWTDEKLELLILLRQGLRFMGTSIAFDDERFPSFSFDALYQGMASAIKSRNILALLVLLEFHTALTPSRPAQSRPVGCDRRPNLLRPFASPIPLHLFHLASKQAAPHSSELISLLLREGIHSIPPNDEILTLWAVRTRDTRDDKIAEFLLRHMEGEEFVPRKRQLFIQGCGFMGLTGESPLDWVPFPKMSFAEEIGYLREDL
ncbi:uncharacterized protein A1O9_11730 [Exophiala aquamarina CBS 119918]|uniref:Uncharacterized protein n=1 Tax=Exophiala aquamarina CBS 119918 TaxID=1182545 RepID=A0A072NW38_9EURO|nr:uncharacterized protein A1O9_11730 [Exophiala aquamarina CBS 119918]KEF52104.1 hypothetical protein A1O9_11730 [Exophiala aquamarina CBS 119918]